MTRGFIIGKVVDDLSHLNNQMSLRSKLGLLDLNKFSEDFVKEILNVIYGLSLVNLNSTRSNEPGLDLGDERSKIAYQITGTKTSTKVNDTLEKITDIQIETYDNFKVFIVGNKQSSYTLNSEYEAKCNFDKKRDIIDISDLCRDIVTLSIDKLFELFDIFRREFMTVKIDFEVPDSEGNYETSLYNNLEQAEFNPGTNYRKFLDWYSENIYALDKQMEKDYIKEFNDFFDSLNNLPRTSREFHLIAQEKSNDGKILYHALKRHMNLSNEEIILEIQILDEEKLCTIYREDFPNTPSKEYYKNTNDELMSSIIDYANHFKLSIKEIFVRLNFKLFDGDSANG